MSRATELTALLDDRGFCANGSRHDFRWPSSGLWWPSEAELDDLDLPDTTLTDATIASVMASLEHSHRIDKGNPYASIWWLAHDAFERVMIFETLRPRWPRDGRVRCALLLRQRALMEVEELVVGRATSKLRKTGRASMARAVKLTRLACELPLRLTRAGGFEFDPVAFTEELGDVRAWRRARRGLGITPR